MTENKLVNVLVENKINNQNKYFGRTEHMTAVIFDGQKNIWHLCKFSNILYMFIVRKYQHIISKTYKVMHIDHFDILRMNYAINLTFNTI